ncbi:hypothetical protein C0993_012179 [Termitomyces sp. T159_Od127]|nr:hypothetical protein C0993_012179 [Termitomyces sp. T159_Od127]
MSLQLTASDINFTIVRPIVQKYARLENMAVVYACLVVRSYFLSQCEQDLSTAGVMFSRATLCEILAMKLLRRFASNHIKLVAVLTTRWNPLAGATSEIVDHISLAVGGDLCESESAQSALEMAISTNAKAFLASPVTQKVVNDVYYGRIVFTMFAHRSILADNYKSRAIELYNARNSPFLDHYRLRVPFYGAMLEFLNFTLLLITFVLCILTRDSSKITFWEVIFIILAAALTLEEYTAATEHGWIIYIANLWNVFDFSFIAIFLAYMVLRLKGINHDDSKTDSWCLRTVPSNTVPTVAASDLAFDVLSCGACVLFPRSLRAMVVQFILFIGMAAICFSGLLFSLWKLSQGGPEPRSMQSIAWLMTQIWFGNTYLSFRDASSFHPVFGPILMVTFAALSGTLLLTSIYERYFAVGMRFAETGREAAQSLFNSLPRHIKHMPLVEALVGSSSNDIYDAIFDVEVNSDIDPFEGVEDETPMLRSFYSRDTLNVAAQSSPSTRRRPLPSGASSASIHDSPKPKHNPSLPTEPLLSMEGIGNFASVSENNRSPLARLFSSRMAAADAQIATVRADGTMKRIERMLEDVQSLPVQKLKEEMKDLQERQARIENLLLVLTKGMGNESSGAGTGQSTDSNYEGSSAGEPHVIQVGQIPTIAERYKKSTLKTPALDKALYRPDSALLERISIQSYAERMYDRQFKDHPRLLPPRVGFISTYSEVYDLIKVVHSRRYVIHTVGPVYSSDAAEEKARQLASCYRTSLEVAVENQIRHVVCLSLYRKYKHMLLIFTDAQAFPSVSTGIYGYPIDDATRIALNEVRRFVESERGKSVRPRLQTTIDTNISSRCFCQLERVIFVVWSNRDLEVYE